MSQFPSVISDVDGDPVQALEASIRYHVYLYGHVPSELMASPDTHQRLCDAVSPPRPARLYFGTVRVMRDIGSVVVNLPVAN